MTTSEPLRGSALTCTRSGRKVASTSSSPPISVTARLRSRPACNDREVPCSNPFRCLAARSAPPLASGYTLMTAARSSVGAATALMSAATVSKSESVAVTSRAFVSGSAITETRLDRSPIRPAGGVTCRKDCVSSRESRVASARSPSSMRRSRPGALGICVST